jgi:hypothetical protein
MRCRKFSQSKRRLKTRRRKTKMKRVKNKKGIRKRIS